MAKSRDLVIDNARAGSDSAHDAGVTPDFLEKLKALQSQYDSADANYERAKTKATVLKKCRDQMAEELFTYIRGTDASAPLFDREEADDE